MMINTSGNLSHALPGSIFQGVCHDIDHFYKFPVLEFVRIRLVDHWLKKGINIEILMFDIGNIRVYFYGKHLCCKF